MAVDVNKSALKEAHLNKEVKHWQHREEDQWQNFQFNQPYQKGLDRLNDVVFKNTNFDPSTLWQWGTMQAMALIEMLNQAEKLFGAEGQKMALSAMHKIGYDIGQQITANTEVPEDMSSAQWTSFFGTVINRIAYASLESPKIESDSSVGFHIDWCPHQDHYGPFDCRVQRYFVQGMIDAARDFMKSQGRDDIEWDVGFLSTTPSGSAPCQFQLQSGDPEKARQWATMTNMLEQKSLERHGHTAAKNID